ncbi:hypothetical protein [Alteribacillus bidgolensis]|uniref:Uncharacterized protein n=1 Tax=Alteribacillus bidgolensis TaxID=930129 RepID=A0A1G8HJ64_9BACI|nr:hypothetical protein [Alteribacillus bidgolensis]SDI06716.1 hypothetical protein SAMN05216352_104286 [Alteribacillus bidgolensis]
MLWKRKRNYLLASVLSIGIIGTTPGLAGAAQHSTDSITAKKAIHYKETSFSPNKAANHFNQESSKSMKTDKAANTESYANQLGIESNEKDMLSEKRREEALKKKAADYGIEANGKDVNELVKEVSLAELKKEAEELNIDPHGKEVQQIMVEIKAKQVQMAADEIGIETAGKSPEEILDEIVNEHEKEAKHLDIFPAGKHDVDPLMYE